MMDGYGWNWLGMSFNSGTMLLFWGDLIALGFLVLWSLAHSSRTGRGTSDRALDLLRERYARGEITKDDYDRMRHDLNG